MKCFLFVSIIVSTFFNSIFTCKVVTYPKDDIIVEVGKKLVINCSLSGFCDGRNSLDIFWRIVESDKRAKTVDHSFVRVLSDSVAQLEIPGVNVTDSGDYVCRIKDDEKMMKLNVVKVRYQVPDQFPFNCSSNNLQEMNCSWQIPTNTIPTTWTVKYAYNCKKRVNKYCRECKVNNSAINECWINYIYPSDFDQVQFEIVGINLFGRSVFLTNIRHYKIVAIKSPEDLSVKDLDSRNAYLEWKNPLDEVLRKGTKIVYQINVKNSWNEFFSYETNCTNYSLINLTPNTKYEVKVRTRIIFFQESSDWGSDSQIHFLTNSSSS